MNSIHLKHILQNTWPAVVGHPQTKPWFFKRLFEMSPKLEAILWGDGRRLDQSQCLLGLILAHLRYPDQLSQIKKDLHKVVYFRDLMPEHYSYVNKALIYTIHDILGSEFNSEVRDAWDIALNEISVVMIDYAENEMDDSIHLIAVRDNDEAGGCQGSARL